MQNMHKQEGESPWEKLNPNSSQHSYARMEALTDGPGNIPTSTCS